MSSRQDDKVWTQLTESVIGRIGGAAIELASRATAESRVAGAARQWTAAWSRLFPAVKYRAAGAFALAAAATNVAMLLPQHPPGAWWLILPSLAGSVGVALIALSFVAPGSGAVD